KLIVAGRQRCRGRNQQLARRGVETGAGQRDYLVVAVAEGTVRVAEQLNGTSRGNGIRIQRLADVDPDQERRTTQASARLRIGRQYHRAIVGTKPKIGRANEQSVITRCAGRAAVGQEGMKEMVSRAADRDI